VVEVNTSCLREYTWWVLGGSGEHVLSQGIYVVGIGWFRSPMVVNLLISFG